MTTKKDEQMKYVIPDLGTFDRTSGLKQIDKCSDGVFEKGINGVQNVYATGDGKVEFGNRLPCLLQTETSNGTGSDKSSTDGP